MFLAHPGQVALVLLLMLAVIGLAWLVLCWVILFTDYAPRPRSPPNPRGKDRGGVDGRS